MSGIHDVAKAAGIRDEQLKAAFDLILHMAKDEGRVVIAHFGTFTVKRSAARTIVSPQIPGGRADVPERNVLRFHASATSKDVLNKASGKAKGTTPPVPRKKPADVPVPPPAAAKVKTVARPAPAAKVATAAKPVAPKVVKKAPPAEEGDGAEA